MRKGDKRKAKKGGGEKREDRKTKKTGEGKGKNKLN